MPGAFEYFLDAPGNVIAYDTLEFSHPDFTQTYYRVRNARDGLTVTLETAVEQEFEWYPMGITELSDQADLDFGLRIDFGDLGEVLPKEIDAVMAADNMVTKPTVIYRVYRSDDLEAPLIGPLVLEINNVNHDSTGASFVASAPYVDKNKTGETYNLARFFMLRGFVQ